MSPASMPKLPKPLKDVCAVDVSIVIATYDRPDALTRCLDNLRGQVTQHDLEILVIDNHPDSGLTVEVVANFPEVTYLSEARTGAAYARNRGIGESRGRLIVTIDDDVTAPPEWLETLVGHFSRPEVGVVTGNLLPRSLEAKAEQLFERYWSLGCGSKPFEVDGGWFADSKNAIAGWDLGATANAAFRADIFGDPQVGLMEETLGTGTPVGAGEDPYLFYRAVRAGYTLVYDPAAYVWHQHRQDLQALGKQTYRYSKSAAAYHLTTLLFDGDRRALKALFWTLPLHYVRRLVSSALGILDYPFSLAWWDVVGYCLGPWCLWRSHIRVRRLGRSTPYVPISARVLPESASL